MSVKNEPIHVESEYGPVRVIHEYRKKYRLTQKQLSDKINVSVPTIKRYEKDNRCIPPSKLEELFKILNISLEDMDFLNDFGPNEVWNNLELISKEREKINHIEDLFNYIEYFYRVIGSSTSEEVFFIDKETTKLFFIEQKNFSKLDEELKKTVENFFIKNNKEIKKK